MSQVKVSGNASGTGVLTISAPNTNSNYTLTLPANTGTLVTNATAGTVLQVLQTVKTDGFSITGGAAYVDLTGLSVTITPSSATSKILVMFSMYAVQQGTTGTYAAQARLVRNSTNIYVGDAAGSAQQASASIGSTNYNYPQALTGTFLDSPATTSATTYKIQVYGETGQNQYIGGSYNTSAAYDARVPSQILVMEIAA